MQRKPLMRIQEVAAWLNISVKTAHKWSAEGKIPGRINFGYAVRFDAAKIEEWLEEKAA
jgi:excisionase family DNA binding protein